MEYYTAIYNGYEESLIIFSNYIGKYHSKHRGNNEGNTRMLVAIFGYLEYRFFYFPVYSKYIHVEQCLTTFMI